MNRTIKAVAAGALALPALTYAEGLSYTYVEARYIDQEFDNIVGSLDVDGDGFGVSGSLAVAPNWHFFADFSMIDYDFGIDGTDYQVGAGYNHSIAPSLDLIGRVSWVRSELDASGFDIKDDGFGLGALLRGKATEALELEAGVQYVDLGDDRDETFFVAAGRYNFTPVFSAGLSLRAADDTTGWGANFRFNFN